MYLLNLINITSFNGTRSTLKLMPHHSQTETTTQKSFTSFCKLFCAFFFLIYIFTAGWWWVG